MKTLTLHVIFLVGATLSLQAQGTLVREAQLGIAFTVPQGWQYQQNEEAYLLGSTTLPGLVILATHQEANLEALKLVARQGINEEGMQLQLQGNLEQLTSKSIGAKYSGQMGQETVEAYIIGILNPTGGLGVSCMIVTTPQQFTNEHIKQLKQIASTVQFFKPEASEVTTYWKGLFTADGGCRLKYLTSSGGSDYMGGYSSSSSEETIDLCPNGQFGFSSSNSSTFDVTSGFGNARSSDGGMGTWKVDFDGVNALLVLTFNDGREFSYELSRQENKTFLNGTRYFVLYGEDGPGCY